MGSFIIIIIIIYITGNIIVVPVHLALCLHSLTFHAVMSTWVLRKLSLPLCASRSLRAATQTVIPTTKASSLGEKYTKAPCYWSGSEGISICVPLKSAKTHANRSAKLSDCYREISRKRTRPCAAPRNVGCLCADPACERSVWKDRSGCSVEKPWSGKVDCKHGATIHRYCA